MSSNRQRNLADVGAFEFSCHSDVFLYWSFSKALCCKLGFANSFCFTFPEPFVGKPAALCQSHTKKLSACLTLKQFSLWFGGNRTAFVCYNAEVTQTTSRLFTPTDEDCSDQVTKSRRLLSESFFGSRKQPCFGPTRNLVSVLKTKFQSSKTWTDATGLGLTKTTGKLF